MMQTASSQKKPLYLRIPELTLLVLLLLLSYILIALFADSAAGGHQPVHFIVGVMLISFLFSLLIAIIAVIGGIGGGVMFTPILLGFTSMDTLIVRASGLVVAMFSGLIASGPLMRSGLADIKLVFFGSVPIIGGSIAGAYAAIYFAHHAGAGSDAVVRLLLGLLIAGIAGLFILGGSRSETPENDRLGVLARHIGLFGSFWDKHLNDEVAYKVRRGRYGLLLLVGFIGGFFGLGGGWAVVPVFNMLMYVPLKLAAGSSGVLLALGNAAAIWPYIGIGAVLPLFVAPWMLGQVVGGIIGAHVLANINAGFIRKLLIILLLATSVKLIARGIEGMTAVDIPLL